MGKRTMLILAVAALVLALLQKTPAAFLNSDAADFVGGLAAGLWIGVLVIWAVGRR
jgi:hypothetical protein